MNQAIKTETQEDSPSTGNNHVARSARVIAYATLGSRILGAVRDVMTAYIFGAGMMVDAFVIAFVVPNLFRRLLGEGALSSAFLPVYSDYLEKKAQTEADKMASNIFCIVGLLLLGLVITGCIGSGIAQSYLVEGSKQLLVAQLLLILLPYMFFVCLTAVCQAVLNSHRHFLIPALSPLVLNIFWISGLLLTTLSTGDDWNRIIIVAVSIIIGGVVQLVMQFPAMKRHGFSFTPQLNFKDPGFQKVIITMMPIIIGIGVLQINSVLDNVIAEALIPGHGPVSYLYYGNRLLQFPLSIIGMAMAVAAFPTFSRLYAQENWDGLQEEFLRSMRLTFYIAMPAGIGLYLIRYPLVHLLFAHGEFMNSPEAIDRTATVIGYYAIGVCAYCLVQILMRAFYAIDSAKTPFRISACMVFFNLCLNLILIRTMKEAGLALATSISGVLVVIILAWLLQKKIHFAYTKEFRTSIFRTCVNAGLMTLVSYLICQWIGQDQFDQWYAAEDIHWRAVAGAVIFCPCVIVYMGLSYCWQKDEFATTLHK